MRGLLHWLARWPLSWLHRLGAIVGWLTYALSPSYRSRFVANARQAGLAPAQSRPAIAAAGRMLFELAPLWGRAPGEPLPMPVTWHGVEHLAAAHAKGRGVLLMTPHLGCFEILAQSYAERFAAGFGPITVLYRPARKPWLRPLVDTARLRPGLAVAPATLAGVRQMIRALRRGETVGLLPDQVPPRGLGVWVPFFDRPAYTMTLAARLAQQSGAVPLTAWGERLPAGAGYLVHVLPFEEAIAASALTPAESAAAVNRAMERLIRARPQQYLWGYHRYKAPVERAVASEAAGRDSAGPAG